MARVLVVDDEATWKSVSEALKPAGHDVAHATNSEQALKKLEERTFHVLITELSWSSSESSSKDSSTKDSADLDGLALLRRVGAAYPNLACLVLTSRGTV